MLHGIIEALPFPLIVRRLMTPSVHTLKASFKVYVTQSPPKCSIKTASLLLVDCGKLMDWSEEIDRGYRLMDNWRWREELMTGIEVTSRLNIGVSPFSDGCGMDDCEENYVHIQSTFLRFIACLLSERVTSGPKQVWNFNICSTYPRLNYIQSHGAFVSMTCDLSFVVISFFFFFFKQCCFVTL